MNELRCERSFMMMPIGRLALPGVAASPLEVVQIIGGFGIRIKLRHLSGIVIEKRCAVSIRASRLVAAECEIGSMAAG
jgi:hypothetical protein